MSFAWLPPELQQRIILAALQLEPRAPQQLTNLASTSKDCYALATRLAWKHIRVSRPSTLRLLHAAITSNPALGELVQSIHIGPDDELPDQGWPLLTRDVGDWTCLDLITTLPEAVLPRWVKPGSGFGLDEPVQDCKHSCVAAAVRSSLEGLDVEPFRVGYSRRGQRIGFRAWAGRLWEAQAALDIYLKEVRRIEDTRGYNVTPWSAPTPPPPLPLLDESCRDGACGHYPPLAFDQLPFRRGSSFAITRNHIRSQLARRDSPTNHFDHLILFARSTRAALDMSEAEWKSVKEDLGGPHGWLFSDVEFQSRLEHDQAFAAARKPLLARQEGNEVGEVDEGVSSDEENWAAPHLEPSLQPRAGRAEDLLALARRVLATTPQVNNLSLTGFCHRALDGIHSPHRLQSLSLGPLSRWWQDVLPPLSSNSAADGLMRLPCLPKLRVCGMMSSRDASKIAKSLPKLKKLVWEMTEDALLAMK